jgi:hypothetical protein
LKLGICGRRRIGVSEVKVIVYSLKELKKPKLVVIGRRLAQGEVVEDNRSLRLYLRRNVLRNFSRASLHSLQAIDDFQS